MNQVEIRILGMEPLSFSSEILNPLYGMKYIEWQFSFKSNFFEEDIPNVLYVGAKILYYYYYYYLLLLLLLFHSFLLGV